MATAVPIPDDLTHRYSNSAQRRDWLDALPGFIDDLLDLWNLRPELSPGQQPWNGTAGIVIPVLTAQGTEAVLKVAFPYDETRLEPAALSLWNGNGAVRMLDQDAERCALLLERLDGHHSLDDIPIAETVDHWGSLLRQLSIAPDGRPEWDLLPRIAATAERWSDELPERWNLLARPFPRWLLEAALEVCQTRGEVGRRGGLDVLVHTDLHYWNVLARPGGHGYAAIDPQPQLGEAEFALAPMLWNRIPDLSRNNPEISLLERGTALCTAAGLDFEVARQWSIAREVENALHYFAKPRHEGHALRSLWVASTLTGRTLEGLPEAHELKTP